MCDSFIASEFLNTIQFACDFELSQRWMLKNLADLSRITIHFTFYNAFSGVSFLLRGPSGTRIKRASFAGEKEKVYKVTIMDALKKKGKFNKKRRRFYVSIVSANNALIGEVSRAMVVIREGKVSNLFELHFKQKLFVS